MSFLNIILLGGATALAAPLLIHLLNRSRFQTIDWGAMHLLESAMQVSSRRFQWESLLLLLIRCLIPVVLALSLARPVLTYMRSAGADGDKSIVLLLDDSLSMAAHDKQGNSLFENAQSELATLVEQQNSAEMRLWTVGGIPRDALDGSSVTPQRLQRSINAQNADAGRVNVVSAIGRCLQQIAGMTNPNKHMILASDFRQSDWDGLRKPELLNLRKRVEAIDSNVTLTLLKVSRAASSDATPQPNLSLTFNDASDFTVLPGETRTFKFLLRNNGVDDRRDVRILISIDGQEFTRRSLSIAAGSVEQVVFACVFPDAGWHSVSGQVEDRIGLPGDDRTHHIVQVLEPTTVMLVTDSAKTKVNAGADFLRLALAPFESSDAHLNRFQVETVEASQLNPKQLDPEQLGLNHQAIILAGVSRLNERAAEALVGYVQSGGGLLVFPDDGIDLQWYNRRFSEVDPLLPMRFSERLTSTTSINLLNQTIQHPGFEAFNGTEAGDLTTLEFHTWHPLQERTPDPTGNSSSKAVQTVEPMVVLRLADGEPFLVFHESGKGRVVQCVTSCSDRWSNMPTQPVYVSFMQQLTRSVVRNQQDPNIVVGQSVRISAAKPLNGSASEAVGSRIQISRGHKKSMGDAQSEASTYASSIELVDGAAIFSNSSVPGLYRFEPENDSATLVPPMLSVSVSAGESDLRLLSDRRLDEIANLMGATVVRSADEFSLTARRLSDGSEVWRWLILALLVLLFAEIIVGHWITRGAI